MKSNTKSIPNWVKRIAIYITLMFCYFPAFAYTSETWARISNANTGNQYVYFLVDTEKKEATVISPSNIGWPAVQYSGKIDLQENVSAHVEGYGNLQFKVTAIGNNAFMGTSLTEIIIPQTVKKIGDSAFKNCSNLRDVIICGRNCNHIGSSCFQGTSSNIFWFNPLEKDTSGILYVPFIGDNAFTSSNHIYVFNSNEYKNHFQYNFSPLIKLEKTFQYSGLSDVDIITELPSDIAISIDKTTLPKNCGTHTGTTQVDIHYRDALYWSDYNDSFTESYNINITKAPLQFDTGTYERFYGDANPIISYSAVHGFVNGETINDLASTPTFYSVANEVSEVGVYPIQVRGEALNYTYSCTGSLYIKPAPLEVTVQPTTSIYGAEPNFKFALNGLKNGEMSPVLLTDFMFSGPTKLSDVGEYVVQIQGGQLKNYEVLSYINGIHTITKAPLTLTANNATRPYYEENPQFDFSLEGLRNSDDETCITTAPQYACSATMESDCGIYDIVPSGADAKNYDISYKPGQLTINPALLTLKVNDISREYGDVNPALTFYCIGIKGEQTVADALSEQPTLVTSATEASNVGLYSVLISGGKSKNYQLSYQSGLLTVNKAPLTVVAENAEKTYGDMNPSFSRSYLGFRLADTESTAFSQLPKLSCTAMQRSEVGTYPITVTGGITKNYEIVEYTPGVLTVTKAPLTLTANNATRPYYEENPQFDFSLEGLRNSDDETCITTAPQYACSATMESDCGIYDIVPSGADAKNYDISYKPGQLTINPALLTLKVNDISREYGDVNPALTFYCIGIKGEQTVADALSEQPTLVTSATEASNVGLYSVLISGGKSKNYQLSYQSGLLTVNKAPLTVVAENAEKTYGDMNPSFSRSYLGFRLADTESTAFSQLPKLSCTAMQRSEVGTYPITVTGGITKNYEIVEYTPGVLTVTKAPLTLTANNATRPYYEENPQFDFSLDGLRNGDGKSVITQLPIYTCDAAMSSNAGIYSIIPSSAQAKNYDISYKNGQLSITKRALSASAPTYSRYYGEKNPDFEISYSGFVNGEDFSVLTAPVIANCTADETSDVGTYPITLHGGDAINYEVKSYTSGKLTIEKANQTITWNQDLSNITMGTQIALNATSSSGLPVSYEMSPNNVATLYSNSGTWYLDCYASGAVSIRANHAGDKNHNPSDVVTKTLVVFGGGGSDPSNPQIYLHIEDPGTLPSLIAENRKYQIKNLRLSGYLNGTDINYIREMAGSDAYGNTTAGVLELLDISSCTIVPGGRSYFSKGTSCYTTNNYIGDYMFYNCKVLTNLLLPSNATVIEDYAFADCSRLSVLSIPNGVTSFGTETFRNDIGLLRIPMPENLTSIGDKAFMGCNNLTEIDIPANVFYIGDGIVKDCENISRINVDASNQYFASKDGVLFDYEYTTLKIFPVNNPSSIYKVMNGVTRIAPYSFVNAKKLTEVTLPSSLLTIGTDAFIGCVNLNILHTEAIVPPVCDNDCFESVSKTRCELQVPQGCYNAYWVAPVWSEFNKIVENGSSSINDVSRDNIEVSVDGLNIMITGTPNDISVRIYQMNGLLIYQQRSNGENISYQLATPGTYIVAVGNKTFKILVK